MTICYTKTNRKIYKFHYSTTEKESLKRGLPLVSIDSVHFLNNSLDNLVNNLRGNEICHLSQDY